MNPADWKPVPQPFTLEVANAIRMEARLTGRPYVQFARWWESNCGDHVVCRGSEKCVSVWWNVKTDRITLPIQIKKKPRLLRHRRRQYSIREALPHLRVLCARFSTSFTPFL